MNTRWRWRQHQWTVHSGNQHWMVYRCGWRHRKVSSRVSESRFVLLTYWGVSHRQLRWGLQSSRVLYPLFVVQVYWNTKKLELIVLKESFFGWLYRSERFKCCDVDVTTQRNLRGPRDKSCTGARTSPHLMQCHVQGPREKACTGARTSSHPTQHHVQDPRSKSCNGATTSPRPTRRTVQGPRDKCWKYE